MKKFQQKPTKRSVPETQQHPQDKPGGKCGNRLSKTASRGGKEAPADRGACEEESAVQGSE